MSLNRAKILDVFGVKGGIGKSILSMNLAGVASNLGKRVLLIDMDIYGGSIALALNKTVNKTIYNFVDDYINNRYKDIKDYIVKYNEYIDYISSPKDPRYSNKIDSTYLEILIDKAKFNYDLIILDTNHILNEINLSLLDKSDDVLLVITNDMFDVKNMRSLISVFKDLDKKNYKVLLNDSVGNSREYFNKYDIMDIIKNNIDYVISNKFYISDIDKYIMNGKIITLEKKYINHKDVKVMENIINEVIGDANE